MIWTLLLLPPVCYALSNILDKHLLSGEGEESSAETLLVIGGIFNVILAIPFLIYLFVADQQLFVWQLFVNGLLFTGAMWTYLTALKYGEVSSVSVWHQTIPIFGILGGLVFLNEILSIFQIGGILLIVFGGIILSLSDKIKMNIKVVLFMLASSLLLTINDTVFAYFGRETSLSTALFSDLIGKAVWGILFLVFVHVHRNIRTAIREKLSIQSLNEIIYIIGDALFDVAKLYLPIAVVQATASTQPVFVLLFSIFLYKYAPQFLNQEKEKISRIKIVAILIMVIGGMLLVF